MRRGRLTAGYANVGVLSETVEKRGRQLVVTEDAVPFAEGQVRSDDGRGALVASREHDEEQFTASFLEGNKTEFVEEQQRRTTKPVLESRE